MDVRETWATMQLVVERQRRRASHLFVATVEAAVVFVAFHGDWSHHLQEQLRMSEWI